MLNWWQVALLSFLVLYLFNILMVVAVSLSVAKSREIIREMRRSREELQRLQDQHKEIFKS